MFDPARIPPALAAADDALAARIEEAGLNAAQPPEQLLYDGWLLRYSPGKARRSRSVNAIADGRRPLLEKLAHCRAFYARAGLPCLFRLTPFSRPEGLDGALAGQGLAAEDETRVMVLALAGAALPPLCHESRDLGAAQFARHAGELRSSPAGQVEAHAARLVCSPLMREARRLALVEGGRVVAVGQAVADGDLVGLYDIVTAEPARRRGLATALTAELLRQALLGGARVAYLQVSADNIAARGVYGRLGFADRYAYWYRTDAVPAQSHPFPGEVHT
jgi:ribosomal protein S18 acetylase RimI-like enzyme